MTPIPIPSPGPFAGPFAGPSAGPFPSPATPAAEAAAGSVRSYAGGSAVPRLVVAAPSSGSGKTTVATGLMAAYAGRCLAVSPHKVGPDYIDPGYHALATGRPGRNLDPFLCGPERIAPLFLHGAAGCELAVVEGVMGLHDGASGYGELGSTAQVAKLLRAPVVLVVDASAQGRSVAALVHGFRSWDPEVRIGGVVLNRVGSDRHEALLREALDDEGVPVLGALRRAEVLAVPSRHLGLVPVAERRAEALEWVRALAERVRASCDLEALLALARSAPALPGEAWDAAAEVGACSPEAGALRTAGPAPAGGRGGAPVPGGGGAQLPGRGGATAAGGASVPGRAGEGSRRARPVVAVAGGAAFTFGYAEHIELLTAAGADPVPFDPLTDEALPAGTSGVVIGGGFPEVYAPELSANGPLRAALAAFAGPVTAECAGLLYLVRELDGAPMCGLLDARATMTGRLTLGYREAVALGDSVLAVAGTRLRGHEFHRTEVEPGGSGATGAGTTPVAAAVAVAAPGTGAVAAPAWGFIRPDRRTEGYVQGNLHASYLHVHWAAEPSVARRFVERCAV